MRGRILMNLDAQTDGGACRRAWDRLACACTPPLRAPLRLRQSDPKPGMPGMHSWRKKQKPDCTRSPERVIEFVRFLLTDDWVENRVLQAGFAKGSTL
jgi:hypothetical protein